MEKNYTISLNGQQAVDAGYKFCNGMCYRSVEGIGQLEVVIDSDGIYNGRPNKWVTVSFIKEESNIPKMLERLKELGFAGCEAFISLSTYDGCVCTDEDLYDTVIGEENVINIINAASNDTMKDDFTLMFEKAGMKVTKLSDDSFIAENETWLIAYTPYRYANSWLASAVSYLVDDKEEIIEGWKSNNDKWYHKGIGFYVFSDAMSTHPSHIHVGGIFNHDHSLWEVASFIKRVVSE